MYVLDANILIDYKDSDLNILSLFSQKLGTLYVPVQVAAEVKNLSLQDLANHQLIIYEPDLMELSTAYAYKGALSPEDYLCFLVAQKYKWCCVTNEKRLRNECERNNIATVRGLRLLIELCQKGHITKSDAEVIAHKIHTVNPKHISESILQDFRSEL